MNVRRLKNFHENVSNSTYARQNIFRGKKSKNALMPLIRLTIFRGSVKLRTTCVKAYIEGVANERVKSNEKEKNNEKHGGI